jgi:hypothetical protein
VISAWEEIKAERATEKAAGKRRDSSEAEGGGETYVPSESTEETYEAAPEEGEEEAPEETAPEVEAPEAEPAEPAAPEGGSAGGGITAG